MRFFLRIKLHDFTMSFFCCWKSRGRQGFQHRVKSTFSYIFTKKCGFRTPTLGLG